MHASDLSCGIKLVLIGFPLRTKKEIARDIANEVNISQTKASRIVQLTLDSIVDELVMEGRIELRNFGVFEVRKRAAKTGRHPTTGAMIQLPEKMVVSFKAGKGMEERVARRAAKTLGEAAAEALEKELLEKEDRE